MRDLIFEPTQEYWDSLRSSENDIFERTKTLTPQMYPHYEAAEVWSSGLIEPFGEDTVAYSAIRKFFRDTRTVQLAVYQFKQINKPIIARIYNLDLQTGNEEIKCFSVLTKPDHTGIPVKSQPQIARARRKDGVLARQVPAALMPNKIEYELVREQLERGASGAYTRWSPINEIPDEQR